MNQDKSSADLCKKLVARRYGVCTRTVNNWVVAGLLPAGIRRSSQMVVWPVDVLDEYDRLKRLAAGYAA
ncbi:MAG: hypothetical protein ABI702_03600 [Burkholderiales bacterium]